jgi:soluble lytic murein transglycosylase
VGPDYQALAQARLALADLAPGAERLMDRVPAALQHDPGLVYERVRWRRRKDHYDEAIPLLEAAPRALTHLDAWAVEREVLARYALSDNKRSPIASPRGTGSSPARISPSSSSCRGGWRCASSTNRRRPMAISCASMMA